MRLHHALITASIALAAAAVTRPAAATPQFPDGIKIDLGLDYLPACKICHADGITGTGTVTTLFGVAMLDRGLIADDVKSLSAALVTLEEDAVDSDDDGVTDIAELEAKTDPNQAGGTIGATPVYGCGAQAQLSTGAPAWEGAAAIATIVGLLLSRRRRR